MLRLLHIDDRQALFATSDVGVGSSDIETTSIFEGDQRIWHELGSIEVGYIQNFQPFTIDNEGVTKLHRDALRIDQRWSPEGQRYSRFQRIVQIDDNQAAVAKHVRECSRDRDLPRAIQNAIGIECQRSLEEVVRKISVEQRADSRTLPL